MNKPLLAFLAFWATCLSTPATAATFAVFCDNSFEIAARACTIKLSGRIEAGDADHLRSVLQRSLPEGWHYGALLLDSPGGSVPAALEVATVVRQGLLDTTTVRVPAGARTAIATGASARIRWKCISACFLVWVAGAERTSFAYSSRPGETSDIGLHRPYLARAAYEGPPESVAASQQQVMQATSEYLKRELVPQALIEKMLQRASTQIYWLTDDDADITGRAPWFEEMMIARCGYDPTYDRESSAWAANAIDEDAKRQLRSGKTKLTPIDLGPRNQKYIEWRQRFKACEYGVRRSAQATIR
jgi:hypothetical protein